MTEHNWLLWAGFWALTIAVFNRLFGVMDNLLISGLSVFIVFGLVNGIDGLYKSWKK